MVTVERADDPCLLERREAASSVELAHLHGGVHDVDVRNGDAKVAKAEPSGGAQALETIEHLEHTALLEPAKRRELTVLLERRAHCSEGGGVSEPEWREALTEIGDGNEAVDVGGSGHDAETTTSGSSRSMRVRDAGHTYDRSGAFFRSSKRGR